MTDRNANIEALRARIEDLDAEIIRLLGERFARVRLLGREKSVAGLAVENPAREADLRALYRAAAADAGLAPDFVLRIFELVLARSKAEQRVEGQSPRSA